jgi:hypothetical protein
MLVKVPTISYKYLLLTIGNSTDGTAVMALSVFQVAGKLFCDRLEWRSVRRHPRMSNGTPAFEVAVMEGGIANRGAPVRLALHENCG